MRRKLLSVLGIVALAALATGLASTSAIRDGSAVAGSAAQPDGKSADSGPVHPWQPPSGLRQVRIWPDSAPGISGASQLPESLEITKPSEFVGGRAWAAIHDVTSPTMTVFPPKGKNSGVAMVVFPGGGFQVLAIDLEGTEICDWMTSQGITCVLLKYRVPKSAHYWDKACRCHITPEVPRALQDAQRTIRLVRSRAQQLNIDPHKVGVIGMSAGGYLVAQTSNMFDPAYKPVDEVDRLSSRPDFAVALYPGHLCRSGALDPGLHVTKAAPPTFILQAWNDPVDEICNSILYARALDAAGVSTEVHLFAEGGHAFGLRPTEHPITRWPALVTNWLREIDIL